MPDEVVLGLIVVFDRFHSYQFRLIASKINRIIKSIALESVYYKYGVNIAVAAQMQKFLVIKYVVDAGYGKLQELYGCFDPSQYILNKDNIREHHSFAAYVFKRFQTEQTKNNYPWVLEHSHIYHLVENKLEVISLNNSLTATISGLNQTEGEPLYTQNIVITANNPSSGRSANILLQAVDQIKLSGIAIAAIVVGGILFLLLAFIFGRMALRKVRQRMKLVELQDHAEVEDA